MKKTITKEVTVCDICGSENTYFSCLECGKNLCYKCQDTYGKVYKHSVYFSGSGDGEYCNECDKSLRIKADDQLHQAYLNIEDLINEYDGFHKSFQSKSDNAENKLKKLRMEKGCEF